ncbi:hypothetical protein IQ254_04645 [Nodosilinea sp. LEGE 07088]|uniref:hypothetical protein n=1 Tax=Nodosilinea sp. LEGE 07088 TaxID=2777968 RepID=UPI00187EF786|nr:hypothetical protein [Nodosilinea sp. LEGE 07088]MBE9136493.1 hypothetical protein [Nodosilinea sp. LEGE 07088]
MPPLDIRQRAIALLDQLPQNKLAAVVQLLEVLAEPVPQAQANPGEAPLLAIIQWQLPAPEQSRLDDLRDAQRAAQEGQRCEWGELTDAEHQELLHYEDRLEQHRVERLEALIALAKLRNLDLISLNQQFSSPAQPFNAACSTLLL